MLAESTEDELRPAPARSPGPGLSDQEHARTASPSARAAGPHGPGARPRRVASVLARWPPPPLPRRSSARRCSTATSPRAPSSCPSRAGRCPSSTTGIREEHVAVRDACGRLRRLAHGRDRDQRPAGARSCCSACSPTTSTKIAVGGAQYSRALPRGRRRPRRPLHLPPRADRYLTVTNAANHDKDLAWFQRPRRPASTSRSTDAHRATTRCSPCRARGRARSSRRSPTRRCPARMSPRPRGAVAGRRRARLRHRLHRRGRRRAALRPRRRAARCGTSSLRRGADARGPGRARHAAPGGLLPPLRQRPDARSAARSRPAWAGAARRTRASSAPRPCAPCARPARREARRLRDRRPRHRRARATRSSAAARSTSGTMSPCLGVGIGMAYVPAERAAAGHRASRSTCAARSRRRRGAATKPLYRRRRPTDG